MQVCKDCRNGPEAVCLISFPSVSLAPSCFSSLLWSVCDQRSSCIRSYDSQNTSYNLLRSDLQRLPTPPLISVHSSTPWTSNLEIWQGTSNVIEAVCCWRWGLTEPRGWCSYLLMCFNQDTNFDPFFHHQSSSITLVRQSRFCLPEDGPASAVFSHLGSPLGRCHCHFGVVYV